MNIILEGSSHFCFSNTRVKNFLPDLRFFRLINPNTLTRYSLHNKALYSFQNKYIKSEYNRRSALIIIYQHYINNRSYLVIDYNLLLCQIDYKLILLQIDYNLLLCQIDYKLISLIIDYNLLLCQIDYKLISLIIDYNLYR